MTQARFMVRPMDWLGPLTLLTSLDAAAVALIIAAYFGIGLLIEHPPKSTPSVTVIMTGYRQAWMREFVTRQPRIFDAQMLGSLRQGTSFFASTCFIAIGGVLTLIGNTEQLSMAVEELSTADAPDVIWQIKLALVVVFLTNGFLKFVWANRLFGYCAVVMAAVSNDVDHPMAYPRAAQAAEINIRAAWNFNRGLRSLYFALAALAWLAGPFALGAATLVTLFILWSREFRSRPRDILQQDPPKQT